MKEYSFIKMELLSKIRAKIDLGRDVTDDEIFELIREIIIEEGKDCHIPFEIKQRLQTDVFNSLRKLDVLQELVDDPTITEIMINGYQTVFTEKNGVISRRDISFESRQKLEDIIQKIVSACNRVVNESSPIVDARLENGSRVNVVLPPIALNGPIVTIRRFPDKPISMENLIDFGAINQEVCEHLCKLVVAGYNIFISGGTGSGKTTFLNALSNYIPKDERIITIEDSAELQIQGVENLVSLETRNSNTEECREISIRDLIKSALRMRPDRIIVGEVRGAEAMDLLQALNTGHDGSLSTGHSNSAKDMLSRLETMVLMGMDLPVSAIRKQIASGIDIIVHLGRLRDKSRKVLEICEVSGIKDGDILLSQMYVFEQTGEDKSGRITGKLACVKPLENLMKWRAAGFEL